MIRNGEAMAASRNHRDIAIYAIEVGAARTGKYFEARWNDIEAVF
jgi:hypothetical protein